jgi:hypothetical protein
MCSCRITTTNKVENIFIVISWTYGLRWENTDSSLGSTDAWRVTESRIRLGTSAQQPYPRSRAPLPKSRNPSPPGERRKVVVLLCRRQEACPLWCTEAQHSHKGLRNYKGLILQGPRSPKQRPPHCLSNFWCNKRSSCLSALITSWVLARHSCLKLPGHFLLSLLAAFPIKAPRPCTSHCRVCRTPLSTAE